jgi:hypothetical protein
LHYLELISGLILGLSFIFKFPNLVWPASLGRPRSRSSKAAPDGRPAIVFACGGLPPNPCNLWRYLPAGKSCTLDHCIPVASSRVQLKALPLVCETLPPGPISSTFSPNLPSSIIRAAVTSHPLDAAPTALSNMVGPEHSRK